MRVPRYSESPNGDNLIAKIRIKIDIKCDRSSVHIQHVDPNKVKSRQKELDG